MIARLALVALVAASACGRDHSEPSVGSRSDPWDHAAGSSSTDPWASNAVEADAPPSRGELHRRADELCPKVAAPYFYRVEKAGAVSYLLGTRHISVPLAKFPAVVRDRIRDAKLAVFEVAPDDDTRPAEAPARVHLRKALGEPTWEHYRELLGHRSADASEHTNPSTAFLREAVMYEDIGAMLERDLQAEATDAHVAMRGLETARFQDELIEHLLDLRMLRVSVEQTKDRKELEVNSAEDLRTYCAGKDAKPGFSDHDRAQMRAGGYREDELDAIDDQLVFSRNASWIPELQRLFDAGGAFVAVGADHLRGPRGVVELLRAKGYTLTRIDK